MESKLDDYQNAINNKDIEIIKKLNNKYLKKERKEILYELYDRSRLDYKSLKNIISILLKEPTTFKITSKFLGLIIKKEDIRTLKLILNSYRYKNDLIKVLLYKYKYKQALSNSELKKHYDREINYINLNEIINENFETPLFQALRTEDVDIVKLLVKNGADVNKENKDGNTPLIKACKKENKNIVKLLIEYGADVNKENKNIVKLLIEYGADVNKENKDGNTPLIYSCNHYYKDIAELLIENGADVNKENKDGDTPLIKACEKKYNGNIVKLLIENGADVNKENKDGNTPLIKACEIIIQI